MSFKSLVFISCLSLVLLAYAVPPDFVLGPKITIAKTTRDEDFPVVAYNSNENNFLVGWIDRLWGASDEIESRVQARILRSDRSMSAVRTYWKGYYLSDLLVQYDPQHNRYFMIHDYGSIRYQLIGPLGGVIKKGRIGHSTSQALTYHPLNQEYLLASPLQRFSKDAEYKGASTTQDIFNATLLPDSTSTNYFLFHTENDPLTIYFQVLRADGTALTTARPILHDWYDSSVAFNPLRREFLLLYASPFRQWRALRFNESGQRLGTPVVLGNKPETYSSAIYYDEHYFVAYNRANRIIFRELDANAQPLGLPQALTDEGAFATQFQMARGEGRKFIVIWSQENDATGYDIYGRFFRPN
jgi:hypothetical protein